MKKFLVLFLVCALAFLSVDCGGGGGGGQVDDEGNLVSPAGDDGVNPDAAGRSPEDDDYGRPNRARRED